MLKGYFLKLVKNYVLVELIVLIYLKRMKGFANFDGHVRNILILLI